MWLLSALACKCIGCKRMPAQYGASAPSIPCAADLVQARSTRCVQNRSETCGRMPDFVAKVRKTFASKRPPWEHSRSIIQDAGMAAGAGAKGEIVEALVEFHLLPPVVAAVALVALGAIEGCPFRVPRPERARVA